MARLYDLTGQKFGRLTVVRDSGRRTKYRQKMWECLCDCGKTVFITTYSLRNGITKSCGCLQREKLSILRTTHKMTKTSEYRIRANFIQRCYNPNHPDYEHYGGRGIKVCDRWLESFENFYEDMGPRPSHSHTLDRIDNGGDYCFENCKWVDWSVQSRNKRTTKIHIYKGEEIIQADLIIKIGINKSTFRSWIAKGLTPEEIEKKWDMIKIERQIVRPCPISQGLI